MRGKDNARTGGEILIDQLSIQGVQHAFCVPGESYLAALDAFYDSDIKLTVCRHESTAAMMAEAVGKVTSRPGICFVTRGPGATNSSAGIHIARQDSSPMIAFVGQVAREMRNREAFQELDYRAMFGSRTACPQVTQIGLRGRGILCKRSFRENPLAGGSMEIISCPRPNTEIRLRVSQ
jgi:acetolactate synthase-1/2/3 large subunit